MDAAGAVHHLEQMIVGEPSATDRQGGRTTVADDRRGNTRQDRGGLLFPEGGSGGTGRRGGHRGPLRSMAEKNQADTGKEKSRSGRGEADHPSGHGCCRNRPFNHDEKVPVLHIMAIFVPAPFR